MKENKGGRIVMMVTGLLVTIIALIVAAAMLSEASTLRSSGKRAVATVLGTRDSRGTEYHIHFQTASGRVIDEWTFAISGAAAGDRVTITYDPSYPEDYQQGTHPRAGVSFYVAVLFVVVGLVMFGSAMGWSVNGFLRVVRLRR